MRAFLRNQHQHWKQLHVEDSDEEEDQTTKEPAIKSEKGGVTIVWNATGIFLISWTRGPYVGH